MSEVRYTLTTVPALPEAITTQSCFNPEQPELAKIEVSAGEIYWYDAQQNPLSHCEGQSGCVPGNISESGSYVYYAKQKLGGCYSELAKIDYQAYPIPSPQLEGPDSLYCRSHSNRI
ncbi:MAG: hypothetical protein IPO21_04365 [Bacteroidales bacterium]|nr:hypothetical protein [Bacteroidales bacterium]